MFYQIFFSPQVKRCAIITYKHGVYELPHELPNYVRFRILGSHCPRQVPAALALAPTREKKIQDPRKLGNFKNVSKLPTIIV